MKLKNFRNKIPRQKYLLARLNYNPITGEFSWITSNKIAGTTNFYGYRTIKIDGINYYAHRLAFVMTYGDVLSTEYDIDHINGRKLDNRIVNLRAASRTQNQANSINRTRKKHNLPRGVTPDYGKYSANITVNHKRFYLGYFDTVELAHSAYMRAHRKHFGQFTRFGQ